MRDVDALRELLELLVADAAGERLAQVAVSARAEGTTGAELTRIQEATELALRLRHTLTAHRRRETELAALFDSASDLAALRDLDAVLRSIVRRARSLLGTDVAYLTLHDEEAGDTYMRVTDGSISALFQQLRLAMGAGLGGLVAQTSRPYATSDYPADKRFRHTTTIDAGVHDEGLVAILGVPLKLSGRVIGVLFAADRSPREFAPEDVALLSSLADHAAIAIDTARLLEETRSANDTIRAHNEAMSRAQDAHDRLTDLILRGGDVPEVAASLAEVLGGGLVVHDAEGAELARIGDGPPPPAELVEASSGTGRALCGDGIWVCAVLAGPELLGAIALSGRPSLGDADRRLFERASVVTALLLLLQRSRAEAENQVRGELVTDLLGTPGREPAGLIARGRRVGVDLTAATVVLVAWCDSAPRARLAAAAARHARTHSGLAGAHGEETVLLLPGNAAGEQARAAAKELAGELGSPVTVGAAGPARGPESLATAHAEAARCLRALLELGRVGEAAEFGELGFVGVLLGDRADVSGFVSRTLGPLLSYDERRGTHLVSTLDAYFAAGGHLNRAKEALHVHVNTVVQRLERVGVLLGEDWQEPDRALEIQLALRLHRLSK